MKVDTSRLKKGTSEVPPECKQLIDRLSQCDRHELIIELTKIDTWTFGKCELYHWIDILDIFDTILEEATQTNMDINEWLLNCDMNLSKEDVQLLLLVLNFTTLLIEHSFSRHLYNSIEHLTKLLSSSNMDIVLGVLNLLYMFSKRSNFISRLNSTKKNILLMKLNHIAESWGGKEYGFSLANCCRENANLPKSASTFFYEFYNTNGSLDTIEYPDINSVIGMHKNAAEFTKSICTNLENLDEDQKMHIFTRIRLAISFDKYPARLQFVQARLQGLSVLVYSNSLQDNIHTLLYPGFLEELVELLELKDINLVEIRAAALRTLTSIIHLDRNPHFPKKPGSRLGMIIDVTGAASYHGFLPTLVRTCIHNLTAISNLLNIKNDIKSKNNNHDDNDNNKIIPMQIEQIINDDTINNLKGSTTTATIISNQLFPLPLATALFSFLYHLASYESGGEALVACGMMESLLRVINWPGYELEHITFVTRAVRVIDLITNIEMQSFQNHNGLDSFIGRLDMEVNYCRREQPYEIEPTIQDIKLDIIINNDDNNSNGSNNSNMNLNNDNNSCTNSNNDLIDQQQQQQDDTIYISDDTIMSSDDIMILPSESSESSLTPTTSGGQFLLTTATTSSSSSLLSSGNINNDNINKTIITNSSSILSEQEQQQHEQQNVINNDDEEIDDDNNKKQILKTCLPQRAALLKSMLNFLKKAIQDQAFSDSIRHVMEGTLPSSLRHIISNAEYYGPSLFLLATDVVTVYVFQEPSLLSSLQDNGLTDVVLQALLKKDVPATREVLGSLPNVFSALCLNSRGLQSFVKYEPFERLFKVLLSPIYLMAMRRRRSNEPMGDTASNLGNAMDELMRHQPSLKPEATKAIIKLLHELVNLGTDPKYICWRANNKNDLTLISQNNRSTNGNIISGGLGVTGNVNGINGNEAGSSDEDDDDEEEASTSSHHNQRDERNLDNHQSVVDGQSSTISNTNINLLNDNNNGNNCNNNINNDNNEREPIPLIDYILNVMKFVDAILSNNSTDDHCREFVQYDGLQPLLSILSLPNLPVDSPITTSAQAVAAVCKSILNLAHEPEVLQVALNQLSIVVDKLQPLQVHIENPGGSVLLRELANCPNIDSAFSNSTYTPLLHAMSAVHGYIVMLVHICRTGQSEIRTILLAKWGQMNKLLTNLVQLYTALVWESTLLLALCTDDVFPSECEFGKEDIDKLPSNDDNNTTTTTTSQSSAVPSSSNTIYNTNEQNIGDRIETSSVGQSDASTNTENSMDVDISIPIISSEQLSTTTTVITTNIASSSPTITTTNATTSGNNYVFTSNTTPTTTSSSDTETKKKKLIATPGQLRYIKALLGASSRLGRALAELFGNLVKLCVGSPLRQRRGQNYPPTPAYTSKEAKDIARVLSYILVDGFSYEKLSPSPIPKLKLTFLICSVGFTGPMLFDEKRYAFHLMLHQFVREGGLMAFFQMFEWALTSGKSMKLEKALEIQKFPDGTGEFLDAWLMLLEKMVNPKAILESPHIINPRNNQSNNINNRLKPEFDSVLYLVTIHRLAFEAVIQIWGMKPLQTYGVRMTESMMSILKHIIKGEKLVRIKYKKRINELREAERIAKHLGLQLEKQQIITGGGSGSSGGNNQINNQNESNDIIPILSSSSNHNINDNNRNTNNEASSSCSSSNSSNNIINDQITTITGSTNNTTIDDNIINNSNGQQQQEQQNNDNLNILGQSQQLRDMGFSELHITEALMLTSTLEEATNYLLNHPPLFSSLVSTINNSNNSYRPFDISTTTTNTSAVTTTTTITGRQQLTTTTTSSYSNTRPTTRSTTINQSSLINNGQQQQQQQLLSSSSSSNQPQQQKRLTKKSNQLSRTKYHLIVDPAKLREIRRYQITTDLPLRESRIDEFCDTAIDKSLYLMDELPDTVNKGTDLLVVLYRRNPLGWRNYFLVKIVKELCAWIDFIRKKIRINNIKIQDIMLNGEGGQKFFVRLNLCCLLMDDIYPDMRESMCNTINDYHVLAKLICLMGEIEELLRKRSINNDIKITPKWLAQMITFMDLVEKVNLYIQRKNNMLDVTTRIWKWYDVNSGKWNAYSISNNKIIDHAYTYGEPSIRITCGRQRYTINFNCMSQVNEETGNHRPVILALKATEKNIPLTTTTTLTVAGTTQTTATTTTTAAAALVTASISSQHQNTPATAAASSSSLVDNSDIVGVSIIPTTTTPATTITTTTQTTSSSTLTTTSSTLTTTSTTNTIDTTITSNVINNSSSSPPTIGTIVNQLQQIREQIRTISPLIVGSDEATTSEDIEIYSESDINTSDENDGEMEPNGLDNLKVTSPFAGGINADDDDTPPLPGRKRIYETPPSDKIYNHGESPTSEPNPNLPNNPKDIIIDTTPVGLFQYDTTEIVQLCVKLMKTELGIDRDAFHAIMKLCVRLTKNFNNAKVFAQEGGVRLLLTMRQTCGYMGFPTFAILLIRHVLEEPKTLALAMERVLSARTMPTIPPGYRDLIFLLRQMSSAVSRDPEIFRNVAQQMLRIDLLTVVRRNQTTDDNRLLVKSIQQPIIKRTEIMTESVSIEAVNDLLKALVQPCVHYTPNNQSTNSTTTTTNNNNQNNKDSITTNPFNIGQQRNNNNNRRTLNDNKRSLDNNSEQCCGWHIPSPSHGHDKPLLPRATILKFLADAVRSYQTFAPLITEHIFQPDDSPLIQYKQSALSFILDKFLPLGDHTFDREVSSMSRVLIAALASCSDQTNVLTTVVIEVKSAINRTLSQTESIDKHMHLQILAGLIPTMIENCPPENPALLKLHHLQTKRNEIFYIMVRKGLISDLAKLIQYLDLSSPHTIGTINATLKPLETLLRMTNAPGPVSLTSSSKKRNNNNNNNTRQPTRRNLFGLSNDGSGGGGSNNNNGGGGGGINGNHHHHDHDHTSSRSVTQDFEESVQEIHAAAQNLVRVATSGAQSNLDDLMEQLLERASTVDPRNINRIVVDESNSEQVRRAIHEFLGETSSTESGDSDSNGSDNEERDMDDDDDNEEEGEDRSEIDVDEETRQFIEIYDHVYGRHLSPSIPELERDSDDIVMIRYPNNNNSCVNNVSPITPASGITQGSQTGSNNDGNDISLLANISTTSITTPSVQATIDNTTNVTNILTRPTVSSSIQRPLSTAVTTTTTAFDTTIVPPPISSDLSLNTNLTNNRETNTITNVNFSQFFGNNDGDIQSNSSSTSGQPPSTIRNSVNETISSMEQGMESNSNDDVSNESTDVPQTATVDDDDDVEIVNNSNTDAVTIVENAIQQAESELQQQMNAYSLMNTQNSTATAFSNLHLMSSQHNSNPSTSSINNDNQNISLTGDTAANNPDNNSTGLISTIDISNSSLLSSSNENQTTTTTAAASTSSHRLRRRRRPLQFTFTIDDSPMEFQNTRRRRYQILNDSMENSPIILQQLLGNSTTSGTGGNGGGTSVSTIGGLSSNNVVSEIGNLIDRNNIGSDNDHHHHHHHDLVSGSNNHQHEHQFSSNFPSSSVGSIINSYINSPALPVGGGSGGGIGTSNNQQQQQQNLSDQNIDDQNNDIIVGGGGGSGVGGNVNNSGNVSNPTSNIFRDATRVVLMDNAFGIFSNTDEGSIDLVDQAGYLFGRSLAATLSTTPTSLHWWLEESKNLGMESQSDVCLTTGHQLIPNLEEQKELELSKIRGKKKKNYHTDITTASTTPTTTTTTTAAATPITTTTTPTSILPATNRRNTRTITIADNFGTRSFTINNMPNTTNIEPSTTTQTNTTTTTNINQLSSSSIDNDIMDVNNIEEDTTTINTNRTLSSVPSGITVTVRRSSDDIIESSNNIPSSDIIDVETVDIDTDTDVSNQNLSGNDNRLRNNRDNDAMSTTSHDDDDDDDEDDDDDDDDDDDEGDDEEEEDDDDDDDEDNDENEVDEDQPMVQNSSETETSSEIDVVSPIHPRRGQLVYNVQRVVSSSGPGNEIRTPNNPDITITVTESHNREQTSLATTTHRQSPGTSGSENSSDGEVSSGGDNDIFNPSEYSITQRGRTNNRRLQTSIPDNVGGNLESVEQNISSRISSVRATNTEDNINSGTSEAQITETSGEINNALNLQQRIISNNDNQLDENNQLPSISTTQSSDIHLISTSTVSGELTANNTTANDGGDGSEAAAASASASSTIAIIDRNQMSAEVREALGDLEVPEGVDPSFLAALPQEMREEVISEHLRLQRLRQRAQQISIQVEHAAVAEVNPEFLAALPPNIQEEVLAQQRIEQQRQAAATANPNDPVDAAAFFQNLTPTLRQAILTDMEDSQISVLPPELAAEAQNLRRDWESRNRQMMQERLLNQIGSNSSSAHNVTSMRYLYRRAGNVLTGPRFPTIHNLSIRPRWNWSGSGGGGGGGSGNNSNGPNSDQSSPSLMSIMERQGRPLLDHEALSSLLVLLFIDEPKFNTLRLHRVIRNVCSHVPTREWIIKSLLSIIEKTNHGININNISSSSSNVTISSLNNTTIKTSRPQWLALRVDGALGSRANVFIINHDTKINGPSCSTGYSTDGYTISIHPQASPIVCKHTLDLLITLAKSFPKNFLPYRKDNLTATGTSASTSQQPSIIDENNQSIIDTSTTVTANIPPTVASSSNNIEQEQITELSSDINLTTTTTTTATTNENNIKKKSTQTVGINNTDIEKSVIIDLTSNNSNSSNSQLETTSTITTTTTTTVTSITTPSISNDKSTDFWEIIMKLDCQLEQRKNVGPQQQSQQSASSSSVPPSGSNICNGPKQSQFNRDFVSFDDSPFGQLISMLSYDIVKKSSQLTDKLLRLLSFISVGLPDDKQQNNNNNSSSSSGTTLTTGTNSIQENSSTSTINNIPSTVPNSSVTDSTQTTTDTTTTTSSSSTQSIISNDIELTINNDQQQQQQQNSSSSEQQSQNNDDDDDDITIQQPLSPTTTTLQQNQQIRKKLDKNTGAIKKQRQIQQNINLNESLLPKSESQLRLAIEVLTSKSCSEEGLEDATSLLLNMSQCSNQTRTVILNLLVRGAKDLAQMVKKQILYLMNDLKDMTIKQHITTSSTTTTNTSDISPDDHQYNKNYLPSTSSSYNNNNSLLLSSSKPKGMLQDRFTRGIVVITAPLRLKQACELQLTSMVPLISKTSSQAFFLRILKVIIQIREAVRDANTKDDNNRSYNIIMGKNEISLLSEILDLNDLWDTLSECLLELEHSSDNHAVLVLQPAVEAFFLVHASPQKLITKKSSNNNINTTTSSSSSTTTTTSSVTTTTTTTAATTITPSTTTNNDNITDDINQLEQQEQLQSDQQQQQNIDNDDDSNSELAILPETSEDDLQQLNQQDQQQMEQDNEDDDNNISIDLNSARIILLSSSSSVGGGTTNNTDDYSSNIIENNTGLTSVQSSSSSNAEKTIIMTSDQKKFLQFAEKHRTILNQILRQSTTHLSDGPFAVLVDHTRILDFDVKRRYFRTELERLDEGIRREELAVHVHRVTVFEDSFRELYRRNPEEWKNRFYIVFEDEEGQDAGGLLREWYVIISREIFNPMYALFTVSPGDRVTYMINSSSHANPNHLFYYKFVGRVIAKAIYDNKLLECYFTRSFYKHILGIQVKYTDMESEDYDFYKGLVFLLENEVSALGYDLTFSLEVQEFGVTEIKDLIPNGRNIAVNNDNKLEYIHLVCQLKMSNSIKQQLNAFLEGFYDIIPKRLISIFNEQELELLISGLPNVDIEDLRANTEYHKYQTASIQIQWFWRALRSFDQADRAKFLQFVTGTSKVPLQGFAALEGMNGVQKFQIHRDDRSTDRLPSAHTCFNQLDLPVYKTYDKLRSSLLKAIHECSEGFGFA